MPTVGEIAAHWAGWSVLFEVIGPHIMRTTGDPWDVVAYAGGALVAACRWRLLVGKTGQFRFPGSALSLDGMGSGGTKLQRCREAFLGLIPPPRRALLVGEGNGRFLAALRRAYPQVQCVCVDASARMLERARTSLEAAGLGVEGIQFVQADILEWTPPSREFDLWPPISCWIASGRSNWRDWCDAWRGWLCRRRDGCCRTFASRRRDWANGGRRLVLEAMYLFFGWTTGLSADRPTAPDPLLVRAALSFDNGICSSGDFCTLICGICRLRVL